jgi:hypothetical protein
MGRELFIKYNIVRSVQNAGLPCSLRYFGEIFRPEVTKMGKCKNCKWWEGDDFGWGYCIRNQESIKVHTKDIVDNGDYVYSASPGPLTIEKFGANFGCIHFERRES